MYLSNRFFALAGLIAAIFVAAFGLRVLFVDSAGMEGLRTAFFPIALAIFALFVLAVLLDFVLLWLPSNKVTAERHLPDSFSLADPNNVKLKVSNYSAIKLWLHVIDEVPDQFQQRDFGMDVILQSGTETLLDYELLPKERGAYHFHNTNVFAKSFLGLVERRFVSKNIAVVEVLPSVLQMKKYELLSMSKTSTLNGVKKIRRIGHSYEFEQIRDYVKGDDYRSINWRATGRRNQLMVNQYQDERSQQVFAVIDKGRSMRMPFNNMTLMDYAINTSLVIANAALQKYDRAGLLTFSDKIGSAIQADNRPGQLHRIMQALAAEQERPVEANYEALFAATLRFVRRRSLLFLYTNFESYYAMERVLPILRRISRQHLLVVVFFENSEISDWVETSEPSDLRGIYHQTVARQLLSEKSRIVQELKNYGIQSILTRPEDLSINSVNKYLELKARGLL